MWGAFSFLYIGDERYGRVDQAGEGGLEQWRARCAQRHQPASVVGRAKEDGMDDHADLYTHRNCSNVLPQPNGHQRQTLYDESGCGWRQIERTFAVGIVWSHCESAAGLRVGEALLVRKAADKEAVHHVRITSGGDRLRHMRCDGRGARQRW